MIGLSKTILIALLALLISCKSKVEDKTAEINQNGISTKSFGLLSKRSTTIDGLQTSLVNKKYFSIKACFVDNYTKKTLDFETVNIEGIGTKQLDFEGCVFWEHSFDFNTKEQKNCHTHQKAISFSNNEFKTTLRYSIDLNLESFADLSKTQGCQENQKLASSTMAQNGSSLILEDINLSYDGTPEEIKSDVKNLKYSTRIESCLKNRNTGIPLSNTSININIKSENNEKQSINFISTDNKGCFSQNYISSYEQYSYSHWVEKNLEVEIINGPMSGEKVSRNYFVNPWETEKNIFGIDSKNGKPTENPFKKNNKFHVEGVMYIQIGNDIENFKVNNYLGLTVSKSYQVILNPKIDRGHLFNNKANRYVPIKDGKFRLKFMILAPKKPDIEITHENFQDFDYITGADKVVTVQDGTINSLINIPVRLTDLPKIATRTVSVIKLEPLNDINIRDTIVTGFFKAKITWIKTNVIQSEVLQSSSKDLAEKFTSSTHKELVTKIQEQIKTSRINKEVVDKIESLAMVETSEDLIDDIRKHEYKEFIEDHFSKIKSYQVENIFGDPSVFEKEEPKSIYLRHLKKVYKKNIVESNSEELDGQSPIGLTDKHIDSIFQHGLNKPDLYKDLFTNICKLLFKPTNRGRFNITPEGEYERCVKSPGRYWNSKSVTHTNEVNKTTPLYSNGFNLNIGSRFATSYSVGHTEYVSKRVGIDGGIKIPLGEWFGAGIKLFDVSKSWSDSEADYTSEGDDVSTSKTVIVEKFNIRVDGKFQKCILLEGKEYTPISSVNRGYIHGSEYTNTNRVKSKNKLNFYMCSSSRTQKIDEAWYFLQSMVHGTTLLRDAYGPTEIKIIKVIRGENNYREFEKIFRDKTKVYLVEESNAQVTPDITLFNNWGHLINKDGEPQLINSLLTDSIEGAFPGTIE